MTMITGSAKIFAIIANPVSLVRTPDVLNAALEQARINAVIVPVQVSAENLASVMAGFRGMENLGGIVISNPHKATVGPLCDEVSPRAQAIGSVNAVRRECDGRLIADMFDGMGFIAGMLSCGLDAKGQRTLLVGAGGAAAAVAFALAEAGITTLTVTDPDGCKAQALVTRMSGAFPGLDVRLGSVDPTGHGLVINAVSISSWVTGPPPVDINRLRPGMIAAEMMHTPESTPFLCAAEAKGCIIHYGRHMLDSQLRLISEFIGVPTT